ncbi:MAG: histidine--tRNA ligase [Cyclobacteriaceae bacterium]|nr:histidine--tRNA ligase [Cyclobacteriaceae bacterium HetDA_MAG_MS6]
MQKPSIPKGTRDFGPEVALKRSFIISKIKKNFEKYGFLPIETPSIENLSVLMGKYGDEGDQLLFKILNSGDFLKKTTETDYTSSRNLLPKISEKGLRYDLTVPFARFVAMNQHNITFPFKRYQIQPVWRADRPQRGRYREFYQCDADIVGTNSNWNEVELTLLIHDVFNDLGLEGFILKINHREVLFSVAKYLGLAGKEVSFCMIIDKIDKIGAEKVTEEILLIGGNKAKVQAFISLLDEDTDSQQKLLQLEGIIGENKGVSELKLYFETLSRFPDRNLQVELDWSLARGLTYYTGMIYEVKPTSVQMGSITGGGRYDNLTGMFGLPGVSGIGISFGLDRIYDVLEELKLFPEMEHFNTQILIVHFDQATFDHGSILLDQLRAASIRAEIYPDQAKLKKQLNYADKLRIPFVLLIGDEELSTGEYALKDMKSGGQERHTFDGILRKFK